MIRWFARNGVAANLVMLVLVVGGGAALFSIKQELFPQFSLDTVVVTVPYLGASPEEVEDGVIIRIEEAIQGVEGIKEVRSTASEGLGQVAIEVRRGADVRRVKDDIKARVDAITSFPLETERPIVEELLLQRDVMWVAVYGPAGERALKELAERMRDEITRLPGVSQVVLRGVRAYEISIEVSEFALRKYGLTFAEVVRAVQQGSLDVPGGTIRTAGGEILLRTREQARTAADFEALVVRTDPDGSRVLLRDVAAVVDGFVDEPVITTFNGQPAALLLVREVGRESPLEISRQVNRCLQEARRTWLPPGISADSWGDASFYLRDRLNMLINNGLMGFALVMLTLSLFLRPSLAFFVAIGIPVSFLGTFLVAPAVGITINLISLFAFILVLGIVVDDAIVVGESVFSEYQRIGPGLESAIRGTLAVSTPVTFAVLTTMVAFLPVFLLPGALGKFLGNIPVVVIPTLLFSLAQSKLVLPYHLSLCRVGQRQHRDQLNWLSRSQRVVADGLERFVDTVYRPAIEWCLHWRYLTLAGFAGLLVLCLGMVLAGWVRFSPFPSVPSDFIAVSLKLPEGTHISQTKQALDHIASGLAAIRAEDTAAGHPDPVKHYAQFIGFGAVGATGSNLGFVFVELTKSELRDSSAEDVATRWRAKIGTIPGARQLIINPYAGPPTGLPVDIRLTGPDFNQLRAAARELRDKVAELPGLYDVRDTFSEGKREIRLRLKPSAAPLGLRAEDLARQTRAAFYGAQAQRLQRGREDIRVMVRYPAAERTSLSHLENMRVRLPDGTGIPIGEVADIEIGEGFPTITRIDRQRVINIQADADKNVADFAAINAALYGRGGASRSLLEEIQERYPGVRLVKGGEAKDWEETRESLLGGVVLVVFLIYTLLAIPFRSYLQPLIVMSVVPFGLAGAVLGHLLTWQRLSVLSLLGVIALSGVVVNASLVMVDYINRRRSHGMPLMEAVREACLVRFRPILLTSLTTFAGLVPILLERSLQAQFLIPMATSLGFGVLFATAITMLMVPAIYMVLEDCKHAFRRAAIHLTRSPSGSHAAPAPEP